ncbi:DNA cytosine methyltransferase [Vibrio fluvialis]|uniref:DNA cytosine methyltransferase n=1 Tax=Vibrio fluvialis TaxID=676 RepID=UPI001F44DA3D|nr:DNA cytosine methyltransferase [Vibrio fluvialis]MCE7615734.1 DNA cytosine methyltransferase [Vibrio fluvialis]
MTISFGSVCSGIESASVALEPIGFKACWFSEIEPFPCAVLKHHWPDTPNLGDMTKLPEMIRSGKIHAPEMLIGGTPCQAFSIAGKGESLSDARGCLSLVYGDLLNAIDEKRPEEQCIAVWENVPGVLSTKDNAFGWLLGLLAGEYALDDCLSGRAEPLEAQPGEGRQKWPKSGCVIGPTRTVAWRVLDAQYFGLAQRRKRVFVVASARDGFDPAAVLFEREGMRRDFAPSREAGQEVAGVIREDSHWDDSRNAHPTLNQSFNTGGIGASNQEIFSQRGGGIVSAYQDVSHCLNAGGQQRNDYETESFVVHGTQDPCVAKNTAFALGRNNGGENVICFSSKDFGGDATIELSPTLRASGSVNSNPNSGAPPAIHYPAVRRLTEIECERLQGFPDDHTNVPWPRSNSGHRYKAIGNSKAVNVVQWLGERILSELNKGNDQ